MGLCQEQYMYARTHAVESRNADPPTADKDVYADSDDQCSEDVELTSLVKAKLNKQDSPSTTENADTTYELTLESPPVYDTALCYKCVMHGADPKRSSAVSIREAAEVKDCLLKVYMKGHRLSSLRRILGGGGFFIVCREGAGRVALREDRGTR
ncbi:SAG-related sequence [Besnoitia besnoiti]|uniref:SAG-related sequence n=1 Tax=Besnoitia besnoiti TaxID=94643 RepID=A0A2A9MMU1_BESBE|nr:SAG-related sequence [Besnoitia besnoiti]PFH36930.1 SAG-related sequence [Besnoitia besnoiti]